jgi:hypothetical protein
MDQRANLLETKHIQTISLSRMKHKKVCVFLIKRLRNFFAVMVEKPASEA